MRVHSFLIAAASLMSMVAAPSAKATVMYELTAEMSGQFLPVASDAAADLFGVPRGSISTVNANIQVVVDPDRVPFVEADNVIGQEVTYFDAILSARVDINGIVFETTRVPTAGTQQNEIEVNNTIAASGLDAINIKSQNGGPGDLWTSQIVELDDFVGGVFVEDAIVTVANLQALFVGIGTGWLDGYDLPTTTEGFDGTTSIAANLQFGIDLGASPVVGFVALTTLDGAVVTVSAVPEPATALLLGAALLGLGVARGRGFAPARPR